MNLIDIPTEQTTAVTDIILAIVALLNVIYLSKIQTDHRWKSRLWMTIFGLLGVAAVVGAVAHGFEMSKALNMLLWHPINISLGIMVSLFLVAVVYDIWGKAAAKKILPLMILIGAAFFGLTVVWPDAFVVFIIFVALANVFAFIGYCWLTLRQEKGAGWIMTAVLITLIAAGIQAGGSAGFLLYTWEFDHNGVFHLIQTVGVVVFLKGLSLSLSSTHHRLKR